MMEAAVGDTKTTPGGDSAYSTRILSEPRDVPLSHGLVLPDQPSEARPHLDAARGASLRLVVELTGRTGVSDALQARVVGA